MIHNSTEIHLFQLHAPKLVYVKVTETRILLVLSENNIEFHQGRNKEKNLGIIHKLQGSGPADCGGLVHLICAHSFSLPIDVTPYSLPSLHRPHLSGQPRSIACIKTIR